MSTFDETEEALSIDGTESGFRKGRRSTLRAGSSKMKKERSTVSRKPNTKESRRPNHNKVLFFTSKPKEGTGEPSAARATKVIYIKSRNVKFAKKHRERPARPERQSEAKSPFEKPYKDPRADQKTQETRPPEGFFEGLGRKMKPMVTNAAVLIPTLFVVGCAAAFGAKAYSNKRERENYLASKLIGKP